jgi:pyrroloquinoline quinone biosynthesis protein E
VTVPRPYGLLAELTHRCPLHCPYCSNPLALVPRGDELAAADWIRVIEQAAALGVLQIGFSGGEPLLFPKLPALVAAARRAGLYTNLITSAIGLREPLLKELMASRLDTIQISFQSDTPQQADAIAGAQVHERKLAAARLVRAAGLPWSANVVLHRGNIDRLAEIIALAAELGAFRMELANVQFYGWAFANRRELLPTRAQIERADTIARRESERLRGRMELIYVLPDYYEKRPKACLHGWGSRAMTVNPRGDVLPCQAAEAIPGLKFDNVRTRSLADIWTSSEAFTRFRGTEWMPEPCRSCEFKEIDFGGCRCQAALLAGDAGATDPVCEFSPDRGRVDAMLAEIEATPESPPRWQYRQEKSTPVRQQSYT